MAIQNIKKKKNLRTSSTSTTVPAASSSCLTPPSKSRVLLLPEVVMGWAFIVLLFVIAFAMVMSTHYSDRIFGPISRQVKQKFLGTIADADSASEHWPVSDFNPKRIIEDLLLWIEKRNILLSAVTIRLIDQSSYLSSNSTSSSFLGLVTTKPVTTGMELFSIPTTSILTEMHVYSDEKVGVPIQQALKSLTTKLRLATLSHALAIYLLTIIAKTAANWRPWWVYVNSLRVQPCHERSPICWTEVEWNSLNGTPAWNHHFQYIEGISQDYQLIFWNSLTGLIPNYPHLFPSSSFSLSQFRWAIVVLSQYQGDLTSVQAWREKKSTPVESFEEDGTGGGEAEVIRYYNVFTGITTRQPPTSLAEDVSRCLIPVLNFLPFASTLPQEWESMLSLSHLKSHLQKYGEDASQYIYNETNPTKLGAIYLTTPPYPRLLYPSIETLPTPGALVQDGLPVMDVTKLFFFYGVMYDRTVPTYLTLPFPIPKAIVQKFCQGGDCGEPTLWKLKQKLLQKLRLGKDDEVTTYQRVGYAFSDGEVSSHVLRRLRIEVIPTIEEWDHFQSQGITLDTAEKPLSDSNEQVTQRILTYYLRGLASLRSPEQLTRLQQLPTSKRQLALQYLRRLYQCTRREFPL